MKIPANQQQFLNVLIKVNSSKLAIMEATIEDEEKVKRIFSKAINKLLIARLKDTGVLFSFFVTLNLIQQWLNRHNYGNKILYAIVHYLKTFTFAL